MNSRTATGCDVGRLRSRCAGFLAGGNGTGWSQYAVGDNFCTDALQGAQGVFS